MITYIEYNTISYIVNPLLSPFIFISLVPVCDYNNTIGIKVNTIKNFDVYIYIDSQEYFKLREEFYNNDLQILGKKIDEVLDKKIKDNIISIIKEPKKKDIKPTSSKRRALTEKQKKSLEPLEQKILKKTIKKIKKDNPEYIKLIGTKDHKTIINTITVTDIQNILKCSLPTARKYLLFLNRKNSKCFKFIEKGKKGAGHFTKIGIILERIPLQLLK